VGASDVIAEMLVGRIGAAGVWLEAELEVEESIHEPLDPHCWPLRQHPPFRLAAQEKKPDVQVCVDWGAEVGVAEGVVGTTTTAVEEGVTTDVEGSM
jgi:hypothetical protein